MRKVALVVFTAFISLVQVVDAQPAMDSRQPEGALQEARLLLLEERYKEAVKAFRKACELPSAPALECFLGLAESYNKIGAFKDGAESAERAVALAQTKEDQAIANGFLGVARYANGAADASELRLAEAAFRRVLELTDGEVNGVRFSLGLVLLRQERDSEGIKVLEDYLGHGAQGQAAQQARSYISNPKRARVAMIPDLELTTLAGEYLANTDLAGKVVLLDFWGTWCGPCRQAVPHLRRISRRTDKHPFLLLSIASGDEETVLRQFVADNEMTWHHVLDQDRTITSGLFSVQSFPTYILIDHQGEIVYRKSGWSERVATEVGAQVAKALRVAKKAAKVR